MTFENGFQHGPNKSSYSGGECRGEEGVCGNSVGGKGATGVETIPTDPEHTCTDHAENHAVWRHWHFAEADSATKKDTKEKR